MSSTARIRNLRDAAMIAQEGMCFYCCRMMLPAGTDDDLECTADHRVPRALGGGNTAANIVASCRRCNQSKGDDCSFARRPGKHRRRRRVDEIGQAQQARKQNDRMAMWKEGRA